MRPGWNPGRRNRHVGTKVHGHGQDNRLEIPLQGWMDSRSFFERLRHPVKLERQVGEHTLKFLVEPARQGFFYPCSVDDVCRVLSGCPAEYLAEISMVVFRQSTRKQWTLRPAWGRAVFWFKFDHKPGTAVVIEASSLAPIHWKASLGTDERLELERLRADGHRIETLRRGVVIHPSPDSLRNTVLYRTLMHEVGHLIDGARYSGEEWALKTKRVKEDFAHRFAQESFELLKSRGLVPFAPILDPISMEKEGLDRAWFVADPQLL